MPPDEQAEALALGDVIRRAVQVGVEPDSLPISTCSCDAVAKHSNSRAKRGEIEG